MAKTLADDVVRATTDEKAEEDWGLILDICDRVNASPSSAGDVVKAVKKRLLDPRPRVVLFGLSLLGALVDNCKKPLHLEVCTRDMVETATKLLQKSGTQQKIADKMKELVIKWTGENFKGDRQLSIFELELLPRVRGTSMTASQAQLKEDEDLAKAIQLSLQEEPAPRASPSAAASTQPSAAPSVLYPQLGQVSVSPTPARRKPPLRSVRALFDFEAAEDNELSFQAGEIINVLDDSDANWWRGRGYRGEGLFPSNFVTSDLTQPAAQPATTQALDRRVRYADEVGGSLVEKKPEISEEKMDLLLEMLKNADATEGNDEENTTLKELEEECKRMAPVVVEKIREVEGAQSELSKLTEQFEDAMALYQRLMKEIPKPVFAVQSTAGNESELPPTYSDATTMSSYPAGPTQYGYQSSLEQPSMAYSAPGLHQQQQQQPQMQSGSFYVTPERAPAPPSGMPMGIPTFGSVQIDGPPPQSYTTHLPPGASGQTFQDAAAVGPDSLTGGFQGLSIGGQGYAGQQPAQFTGTSPYGQPQPLHAQQPLYAPQHPPTQAPVTQVAPLR
ncbi:signal transducing adapter molecule 2-like [Oscarella lobularis]|uniref:signal transducing adapter molecule 2-like n=1 Tax=Oscarella lobularis TaxID=121494 RepID=UPI0033136170